MQNRKCPIFFFWRQMSQTVQIQAQTRSGLTIPDNHRTNPLLLQGSAQIICYCKQFKDPLLQFLNCLQTLWGHCKSNMLKIRMINQFFSSRTISANVRGVTLEPIPLVGRQPILTASPCHFPPQSEIRQRGSGEVACRPLWHDNLSKYLECAWCVIPFQILCERVWDERKDYLWSFSSSVMQPDNKICWIF